ncbi:hypothetical protein HZB05_02960 [Candidatus Wolfebacteria bacterium]|nr:hypothetical protein [Candidatus Wolfebacteria bacterium]
MKILVSVIVIIVLGISGFFAYQKFFQSSYSSVLVEFTQKQQTFSPYTKYEPSFAVDKSRSKIYYIFKAMDDNDIWQIWSASSDLNGNNWREVKQTNSPENKQRPAIIYDPKDDFIYYFYRIGNEMGASERTPNSLRMAVKKPSEQNWHDEEELIGNDGINDTINVTLDSARHLIVFAYTKNNQVTTASLNLDSGTFKETMHTETREMNFIPSLAYDESAGLSYIVFPRARTPKSFDNKDLWLAKVKSDGSGYEEKRLTQTNYDNTWPFVTLDLSRQRIYVSYAFFGAKPTYSPEGIPRVNEEIKLGMANLDGTGWENVGKGGLRIFGVDNQTGVLYGIYQEPTKNLGQSEKAVRYFAAYDPNKNEILKQLIPSGDEQTYYDAIFQKFDNETRQLFGAQQVCRFEGERGIECQIWTYTGVVLKKGERPTALSQTSVEMAPVQPRQLAAFKIIKIDAFSSGFKINTNRKLSVPLDVKITSGGQEVKWQPNQLKFLDQDKAFEIALPMPLAQYDVSYKICAISDPQKPECKESNFSYPGESSNKQTQRGVSIKAGIFEGTDFTISVPSGWVAAQIPGTLVSITNINESQENDPAAQATNFKSYFAVLGGVDEGKNLEQITSETKQGLEKTGILVLSEKGDTIGGVPAKILEMSVSQQGANFKAMMVIFVKSGKYFMISYNTTAKKWPEYKDVFYQNAKSFKFKP